jgi:hypothetical protein
VQQGYSPELQAATPGCRAIAENVTAHLAVGERESAKPRAHARNSHRTCYHIFPSLSIDECAEGRNNNAQYMLFVMKANDPKTFQTGLRFCRNLTSSATSARKGSRERVHRRSENL